MSKLERRITVTAVVVPFLGFIAAIVLLWGGAVDALDLGIFVLMYVFTALGVTAIIWGGLARIFIQHHATWSVNSICHMYGKQPFETEDHSTNNWLVAIVSLGEGWHHNHHAFPTSARHGLQRFQFDPAFYTIRLLSAFGLAWNVRTPSGAAVTKKLRAAAAGHESLG